MASAVADGAAVTAAAVVKPVGELVMGVACLMMADALLPHALMPWVGALTGLTQAAAECHQHCCYAMDWSCVDCHGKDSCSGKPHGLDAAMLSAVASAVGC